MNRPDKPSSTALDQRRTHRREKRAEKLREIVHRTGYEPSGARAWLRKWENIAVDDEASSG